MGFGQHYEPRLHRIAVGCSDGRAEHGGTDGSADCDRQAFGDADAASDEQDDEQISQLDTDAGDSRRLR
jgi:hypothetical protein